MLSATVRLAAIGTAATALLIAGVSTATASQPSGGRVLQAQPAAVAAVDAAAGRVYLGTFFAGGDHNYFPKVRAGSYVVEYSFSVGGAMNTWIDAKQPHIVPLPSGRYLGQVGGGAGQTVDTPAFSMTAGRHRITSQSPELYGPVTVYLKPANN
jgi:hypothetical protein